MPLDKIGINFETIGENVTAPDFNISTTVEGFINDIPAKANQYSLGHLGGVVLLTLFGYLYYKLSDMTMNNDFKYSKIRSVSIASGIASVVGIIMLALGYFSKIYPMVILFTVFVLTLIWVVKEER